MRPIVLMAAEPTPNVSSPFDTAGCRFDGPSGLWKNGDGQALVDDGSDLVTTKTATQEALDESDVSGLTTRVTATAEGIDQSEASAFTTQLTETREAIDQAEVIASATTITKTHEGVDQVEQSSSHDLDYH